MKINEKYGAVIEWAAAIMLLIIVLKFSPLSYGSFSPLKAHELSERSFHYGPSEIIKTIDFDREKIYLCRYKDWFSADTVKKGLIRWYPGNGMGGTPIDYSKQVSYSWNGYSNKQKIMVMKIYGCASDLKITAMLFEDENGARISRYDLDDSRMFIFYYEEDGRINKAKYLRGLDSDGKVIYEEKVGI